MSKRPGVSFVLLAAIISTSLNSMDGTGEAPVIHAFVFLSGLEGCRALLDVCSQALFCIIALEQQLLIFAFDRERGLHRNLPASLHGSLDAAHGFGGLIGRAELTGVFHDVLHEAVFLVNVVDDAEFEGFFKRESISRHHELDRLALAYKP